MSLSYAEAGDGSQMSFIHANGFQAGVYERIIRRISSEHKVFAINFCTRARCGDTCEIAPAKISSWFQLADELITFIEDNMKPPIIAVGHSFGGTTSLLAADKRPELFAKLILLDPVLLWPALIETIRTMTAAGMQSKFPLAMGARRRRDGWDSREEAYDYFKDKSLFRDWDDEVLRAYIDVGLYETEGVMKLSCPPESEAQIFESYPTRIWEIIEKLKTPSLLVRGEKSDTLVPEAWDIYGRLQPQAARIEVKGAGHLFPMEKPDETARIILENSR